MILNNSGLHLLCPSWLLLNQCSLHIQRGIFPLLSSGTSWKAQLPLSAISTHVIRLKINNGLNCSTSSPSPSLLEEATGSSLDPSAECGPCLTGQSQSWHSMFGCIKAKQQKQEFPSRLLLAFRAGSATPHNGQMSCASGFESGRACFPMQFQGSGQQALRSSLPITAGGLPQDLLIASTYLFSQGT